MARTLYPSNEAIGIAFLKAIPGLPTNKISTNLPADPKSWKDTGFVQVRSVGGSPNRDLPQAEPVLTLDCWAVHPDSDKPNWGLANDLAERVRRFLQDTNVYHGQQIDAGPNYLMGRLIAAWPITEPRRVDGDINNYARYTFDVQLVWAVA